MEGCGSVRAFMNCRGDEDIDAKRSRPSIGKPVMGHARKERVVLFGTDQRITSGPAAKRPHSKAEYMTAPERFADSQIPLAPRAPSIHDPSLPSAADFCRDAQRGILHSDVVACDPSDWGAHEAARLHHACWRGGDVAAHGARAANSAGWRADRELRADGSRGSSQHRRLR